MTGSRLRTGRRLGECERLRAVGEYPAVVRHEGGAYEVVGIIGGLCPGTEGNISSVAFSSGQPFVVTPCGWFTNTDSGLADAQWVPVPGIRIELNTNHPLGFACQEFGITARSAGE